MVPPDPSELPLPQMNGLRTGGSSEEEKNVSSTESPNTSAEMENGQGRTRRKLLRDVHILPLKQLYNIII